VGFLRTICGLNPGRCGLLERVRALDAGPTAVSADLLDRTHLGGSVRSISVLAVAPVQLAVKFLAAAQRSG
jgi:hypothetical protein